MKAFLTFLIFSFATTCHGQIEGFLDVDCSDSTSVEKAIVEIAEKKFKRYYKKYRAQTELKFMGEEYGHYFLTLQFFDDNDPLLGAKFPACPDVIAIITTNDCSYSMGLNCGTGYGGARAEYLQSQGIDPYK